MATRSWNTDATRAASRLRKTWSVIAAVSARPGASATIRSMRAACFCSSRVLPSSDSR
ncbi:MAG: hypothetical protein R3F39_09245 [Myxococcota bacterium]